MRPSYLAAIGLLVLPACAEAQDAALTSTEDDRQALSLTIYNSDIALIREDRRVDLGTGEQRIDLAGVSAEIRPETVILNIEDAEILEQNFDFDLLTPQKLLEKAVGSRVRIQRHHPTTGEEIIEEAVVLAANNGVVLQIGDRIEALNTIPQLGRIVFSDIPENLRARPTLSVLLDSADAGRRDLSLSYLSGGLTWRADYVGTLNEGADRLDLQGWITLDNQSGTGFDDALTQLVAGDINMVTRPEAMVEQAMRRDEVMVSAARVRREQLGDYHLYSLPRPVTIANNQTKQVSFLTAPSVTVGKHYRYDANFLGTIDQPQHVGVLLALTNSEEAGLGVPLPNGIMRIYTEDSAGRAQFIGEDDIDHTPENAEAELRLGAAFDVTVAFTQTEYRLIARGSDGRVVESSHRVTFANARDETVVVDFRQFIDGDWEVLSESLPHVPLDSERILWRVEVAGKGQTELTFSLRRRY